MSICDGIKEIIDGISTDEPMTGGKIIVHASDEINAFIKQLEWNKRRFLMYQDITAQYFNSKYMKKNDVLLLYWDMGSGKTIGSLLCAITALDNANNVFNKIIILSPKSIQDGFIGNLKILCNQLTSNRFEASKMFEYYKSRIFMVPFNAWNAYDQLESINGKTVDGKKITLDNSIFIIDEAHLFVKSVIKVNLSPQDMKNPDKSNVGNAKRMYDLIRKHLLDLSQQGGLLDSEELVMQV